MPAQPPRDLAADRVKARADDGARLGVERLELGGLGEIAEQDADARRRGRGRAVVAGGGGGGR